MMEDLNDFIESEIDRSVMIKQAIKDVQSLVDDGNIDDAREYLATFDRDVYYLIKHKIAVHSGYML